MNRLYQIFNYQHDPIKVFDTLDEAKRYIAALKETYNETFYVIELTVAYKS